MIRISIIVIVLVSSALRKSLFVVVCATSAFDG